jgi:hypothetical protein
MGICVVICKDCRKLDVMPLQIIAGVVD